MIDWRNPMTVPIIIGRVFVLGIPALIVKVAEWIERVEVGSWLPYVPHVQPCDCGGWGDESGTHSISCEVHKRSQGLS